MKTFIDRDENSCVLWNTENEDIITAVLIDEKMYYLRRDHQGSITGLIDDNGNIAEEYSYDPWGRRRSPIDYLNLYCLDASMAPWITTESRDVLCTIINVFNDQNHTRTTSFSIDGVTLMEFSHAFNPKKENTQSKVKASYVAYIINHSSYMIYFKPDDDYTVDGKHFEANQSYPLGPGKSWYYPVDGVKTSFSNDKVFKVFGKSYLDPHPTIEINKFGNVDVDYWGFGPILGYWTNNLDSGWEALLNSKPFYILKH